MASQTNYDAYRERIANERPLIHHISNKVTLTDCANMTLAVGASPIMADAPEEVAEVTAVSQALVLNLGTPSKKETKAMRIAARKANECRVPIIFDPVGVGVSLFRQEAVKELFKECQISIIRGNASEIKVLAGRKTTGRGVDATGEHEDILLVARELANKHRCVVAVTGKTDLITDGEQVVKLHRGHQLLSRVTGTGCMINSIIASFAAVANPLDAAIFGILTMSLAGEQAALTLADNEGPGTFRIKLFDYVSLLSGEALEGVEIDDFISK